MPQTKPIVSVENVVASASVEQKIDLNEITEKFPDTEYHPEQFPGLVFRLQNPRTATLIFRTGKMVCTGAKSEDMAIKAVNTVVQKLRKGKIKIKPPEWGQDELKRRILLTLSLREIVVHIYQQIIAKNTSKLVPIYNEERPIIYTGDMRTWHTSRKHTDNETMLE